MKNNLLRAIELYAEEQQEQKEPEAKGEENNDK